MEDFWRIISSWNGLGQGLFFLIIIGAILTLVQKLGYYATVAVRGWPPEHAVELERDSDDDD